MLYKQGGMPLGMAVAMWPTPTTQDGENNAGPSQWRRKSLPLNAAVKPDPADPRRLSADWVDLLMGFPRGWSLDE